MGKDSCEATDICKDCTWPPCPVGQTCQDKCWAVPYKKHYVSSYYGLAGITRMKTELYKNDQSLAVSKPPTNLKLPIPEASTPSTSPSQSSTTKSQLLGMEPTTKATSTGSEETPGEHTGGNTDSSSSQSAPTPTWVLKPTALLVSHLTPSIPSTRPRSPPRPNSSSD